MAVEPIQPDMPEFVKTWLDARAASTALEGYRIVTYDDEGINEPPFFYLEDAGSLHDRNVGAYLPFRLGITAYGRTKREAALMWRAITDHLHRAERILVDGIGFWGAYDETGGQEHRDPTNNWPARFGVIAIYMPDRAIVAAVAEGS